MKPAFIYWSSFALSWVDQVTNGAKGFASVIVNRTWLLTGLSTIKQSVYRVRIRLISQLINGISIVQLF